MATITRFNKFLPRDYSMKFYMPQYFVPNFEQWDSLLAGQQQKYNAAVAATQKYPKHLEWRGDLAGQYKKDVEGKLQDITNTFINEGVRSGNRKMRDYAFELNQQWNPGGLAYELEKEFEGYQAGIKQITDYYEKNKAESSANRTYSLHKLNESAKGEFKYDPETGLYTGTNVVPELIPYVDIAEEALKVVKEIKDSGTTDIIKMDPAWFLKIEREGVTEDTIRAVTGELLKQPKYSQQRQVEKWLIDQNTTPEQKAQIELEAKTKILGSIDTISKEVEKLAKSKKEDERKALQQQLLDAGYYTGKVDGKVGKETNAAIDAYKKDMTERATKQAEQSDYDSLINDQILKSYSQPLVKAFAREKVKKDLIFNRAWETNMKIAAQKKQTQDLVTAIQSLKDPATADYLVTPGLGSPMEQLDKMKKDGQQVYADSKRSFDNIAQFSGITDIIGYRAPNKIHEVTQARMASKSEDEFQQRMAKLGYSPEIAKNSWDFYNSPAAGDLYNAYTSMSDAKGVVDGIDKTQESMIKDYTSTPEGKKEIANFKKRFKFEGSDDELVSAIIAGGKFNVPSVSPEYNSFFGYGSAIAFPNTDAVDAGKVLMGKVNNYYKDKPNQIPQSLRGYAVNAIKGEGSELEKVIVDDFKGGYTLGYSSNGQAGIVFSPVGGKGNIDANDVELSTDKLRFDVNASGITYYMTGKDKKGRPVSSVVDAPREHYARLNRMAVDMKKQAMETGDLSLEHTANLLYAVTSEGPQYQAAIDDAFIPNMKNTTQLSNVIDPQRSSAGNVQTFANNANVRGTAIGGEKNVGGNIYQKFKVYNPKTDSKAYIMTMKTEDGLYLPIVNKSGGLYYETSMEADSPIWDRKITPQIPVEINQQKIRQTNVSEEVAKTIMGGISTINSSNE